VWLALAQLSEDVLVNQEIDRPKGLSRRQVLKMGMAVAAVPLISSIVAPTVSASGSGACAPCPCIPHSCAGCTLGTGPGTGCCSPYPDCHGGGEPGTIACCKPSGNSGATVCGNINNQGDCA
jgi:hypothetical protein